MDGKLGTQVQVKNGTLSSDPVALPVTPVAPSIFSVDLSGTGQAAILNQDGQTVNSANDSRRAGKHRFRSTLRAKGRRSPGGIDGRIDSRRQFALA